MRIAMVVDAYAPARTSAAVQMRDLAQQLASMGHQPTVIVPGAELGAVWTLEEDSGVSILRIRAPRTKDIGRVRRALAESMLSFAMLHGLARSPLRRTQWDGVVWYSPTIFFGPFVRILKRRSRCRAYLVLRDLFPDWAVDAGLMRKGPAYAYFKFVERFQYGVADVIAVQTPANLPLLRAAASPGRCRIEVLNNWLSEQRPRPNAVPFETPFPGSTLFVYAGNMGAAQGMDSLIRLAQRLAHRHDVAFLFVGRGTEVTNIQQQAHEAGLTNVEFRDEVEPWELPQILEACDVGLIALDPRHTTHNIPGKFLTYLRAGLPVLAHINAGNDLADVIRTEGVGYACNSGSLDELQRLAEALATDANLCEAMGVRGKALAERDFSPARAARQIVAGLAQP